MRGGSEHGLGIFVSKVEEGSSAGEQGSQERGSGLGWCSHQGWEERVLSFGGPDPVGTWGPLPGWSGLMDRSLVS